MNVAYRSCAFLCAESIDRISKFFSLLSLLLTVSIGMMTTEHGTTVIRDASQESRFSRGKARTAGTWATQRLPLFPPITSCPLRSKPPTGAKAEMGRRTKMEDTFSLRDNFLDVSGKHVLLSPSFPRGMDKSVIEALSPRGPDVEARCPDSMWHYYAVFDGHGGTEASDLCAARMHENLKEAWNNLPTNTQETQWSPTLASSKKGIIMNNNDYQATTQSKEIIVMLERAFASTDDDFKKDTEKASATGSTAVVSLVGDNFLILGYCGDSRAVLCRDGKAYALTIDHKPEREDETDRVQKAGGHVLFFNGPRVMGLLAMSRAIGDLSLRPYVISKPDVCILPRSREDEILILASDGLWDVLTNQEACTLALRCLERAKQKGASAADAAKLTATVLTRAAVDRGSRDNITVVVIDLRQQETDFVSKVDSAENDNVFTPPDATTGNNTPIRDC